MWRPRKEQCPSRRARRQSCGSHETSHLPLSGPISASLEESHKLHQPLFDCSVNHVPLETLFKAHSQAPRPPKILIQQIPDGASESTVEMNTPTLPWGPVVCLPAKNPSYSKIWLIYKSSRLIHNLSHWGECWLKTTTKKLKGGRYLASDINFCVLSKSTAGEADWQVFHLSSRKLFQLDRVNHQQSFIISKVSQLKWCLEVYSRLWLLQMCKLALIIFCVNYC